MAFTRVDGRKANELRKVKIVRGYTSYAPGSVLISTGNTSVLCTATFEPKVPPWREETGQGWLTAEYGMLPSSTPERKRRSEGRIEGRSQEIQRLIGRSLRAVVNLEALEGMTIWIDCDVLQADGGTRTTSITGAYVALVDAVHVAMKQGFISKNPITAAVAAVSAGVVDGRVLLDLSYEEDVRAEADFNVVMTDAGRFVEVQGTAEHGTFDAEHLDAILKTTGTGIRKLLKAQHDALRG